ncbi:hypothetical protein BCR34DRAFT_383721 [Clohesyomyces aquaticus]|uniref:Uncharacterized protein n=1 Tax=Clohesyomyces aquaticus TaxID=1231657 RepID=A0A1Y1ZFW7_9PLEO|nr:hypothetical protein BCR34DRAFT_383721 [Clohesyomyces aquaticus]
MPDHAMPPTHHNNPSSPCTKENLYSRQTTIITKSENWVVGPRHRASFGERNPCTPTHHANHQLKMYISIKRREDPFYQGRSCVILVSVPNQASDGLRKCRKTTDTCRSEYTI